jgi:hypothetical protein
MFHRFRISTYPKRHLANTIQLSANDILKNSYGNLVLDYDADTLSKNTAVKLEVQTDSTGGITQTSSGLKLLNYCLH